MGRESWRAGPVACALLLASCGRTPVGSERGLIVQVVDESGDGVAEADVELRAAVDGNGPVLAHGRTDGYGVTVLPHPEPGTYELHARTDLRCCLREGTLETSLERSDDFVVIETQTGPCPTWTPESCR